MIEIATPKNKSRAQGLRPIVKHMATTLRSRGYRTGQPMRRECWEATTVDGEWAFERLDDVGTPWIIVRKPRTPEAETVWGTFGTLKSARQAVERGIEPWLPSVQREAHERGEHADTPSPYGCTTCRDERWATR